MEEQRWDKKGASRRADVVGALRSGLDRLAEVSHNALAHVGSSDLLHRFWACLEVSISSHYSHFPPRKALKVLASMGNGMINWHHVWACLEVAACRAPPRSLDLLAPTMHRLVACPSWSSAWMLLRHGIVL